MPQASRVLVAVCVLVALAVPPSVVYGTPLRAAALGATPVAAGTAASPGMGQASRPSPAHCDAGSSAVRVRSFDWRKASAEVSFAADACPGLTVILAAYRFLTGEMYPQELIGADSTPPYEVPVANRCMQVDLVIGKNVPRRLTNTHFPHHTFLTGHVDDVKGCGPPTDGSNTPPVAEPDRLPLTLDSRLPAQDPVLYVTQRSDAGVARVRLRKGASPEVDRDFVRGLPGLGPDSVIFDATGHLLISNPEDGSISLADSATGALLSERMNTAPLGFVADLALDPSGTSVWAIVYGGSGPSAVEQMSLADGSVISRNPDDVTALGGITFDGSGKRLFVASHASRIAELNPLDGRVVRSVQVPGAPDGMTFDPTTGHVFASGCGGLCDLAIGTPDTPTLTLAGVHRATDGDGIAADGRGHIYVTTRSGVDLLDLASDTARTIVSGLPSPDDTAPQIGFGAAPTTVASLTFAAARIVANDRAGTGTEKDQHLRVSRVDATPSTHGAVHLSGETVTFTPTLGFVGEATFGYTVCDDGRTEGRADPNCATGTVTIPVSVNSAPVARDEQVSTRPGTAVRVPLQADDVDEDPLTYAVIAPPHNGRLSGTAPNLTYTPDAGFTGTDSFLFIASDRRVSSEPGLVAVVVPAPGGPDAAPRPADDQATTVVGVPVTVPVLANDTDPDGNLAPETLLVTGQPASGETEVVGGNVRYTPPPAGTGKRSFTYRICDTAGACAEATVTVTVLPTGPGADNHIPAAAPDGYQVAADTQLVVPVAGVLKNDSDPDAGAVLTARLDGGVAAGTLLLNGNGSFTYTPAGGFTGFDHFTYHAVDRAGAVSPTTSVTLLVIGADGPPAAGNDRYDVGAGRQLAVPAPGVLANDSWPDPAATVRVQLLRDVAHGRLLLAPDGSFAYVAFAGFSGVDTFSYQVRDPQGRLSDPGMVALAVQGGNTSLTIDFVTPADGAQLSDPTPVQATITPPSGASVTSWRLGYRRTGSASVTELASGNGPDVRAALDPTTLPNGTYLLSLAAQDSSGRTAVAERPIVLDSNFKPGRFMQTWQDLTIQAGTVPIAIRRTYDSTDKSTGDFGVGWHLDYGGFRVDTAGPLGAGPWTTSQCGTFPFLQSCYASPRAHTVTVTWPDGRADSFDFTPARGSSLFPALTTAAFTPRPGTTSTLAADDTLLLNGDDFSSGGLFGTGEVYDPQTFVLTSADGTQYVLDRHGGLQSITDRSGATVSIGRDGIASSAGVNVGFQHDAEGRITAIDDPAGGSVHYAYDPVGDLKTMTDQKGATTVHTYGVAHDLRSVSGAQPVLRIDYRPDGRLASVTDASGNVVQVDADMPGRQEVVTGPDPALTTVTTYDEAGNVTAVQQNFGGHSIKTRLFYDDQRRVIRQEDPTGTTTTVYDAAGNPTKVTTPDGMVTETGYNAFGQPTTKRVDGQLVSTTAYDERGLETATMYPDGTSEAYTYDAAGRRTSRTDRAGRVMSFAYDSRGSLTRITTAAGSTGMVHDADGRLVDETPPTGGRAHTQYTATGKVASYTDAAGHTWRYTYDDADHLQTYTDPLDHVRRYTYDAAGRLHRLDNRAGQSLTYSYGRDGQITEIKGSDGVQVSYGYDPLGRHTTFRTDVATVTQLPDDAGRPVRETVEIAGLSKPVTLTRQWTPTGKLAQLDDGFGTTTLSYGDGGRLSSVSDDQAGRFGFTYDPSGRLSTLSRPNGADDTYSWRGNDLQHQTTVQSGKPVTALNYTYDGAGRVDAIADPAGTTSLSYDARGQLTSATHPTASGLPEERYTYDAAGNRTSWPGHPSSAIRYDAANRLLDDGKLTYAYDGEGRLLSTVDRSTQATTTYGWNSLDQLVSIKGPGVDATFGYDGLGDRVVTTSGATSLYMIYDDQHSRHLLLDQHGSLIARYVNQGQLGAELAVLIGGRFSYPVLDRQRTAVATTFAGGAPQLHRYGSFGQPSGSTGADSQWHGAATGPAELVYTWARPYDPSTGRFLSEDPVNAPNLYVYAQNTPCSMFDPTGLDLVESTIQECESLRAALPGAFQLHHVISNWALRAAKATGPVVYALLTVAEHQVTDTWGRWATSDYMRMWELQLLNLGAYDLLLASRIDYLEQLIGRTAILILCR
jgi:RHS repeat-associated protein